MEGMTYTIAKVADLLSQAAKISKAANKETRQNFELRVNGIALAELRQDVFSCGLVQESSMLTSVHKGPDQGILFGMKVILADCNNGMEVVPCSAK